MFDLRKIYVVNLKTSRPKKIEIFLKLRVYCILKFILISMPWSDKGSWLLNKIGHSLEKLGILSVFSTKRIDFGHLNRKLNNWFFFTLWRTQNGKGEMPIDQKDLSNDLPPFTFCGLSKKNPDFADSILFQTWSLTGIFI